MGRYILNTATGAASPAVYVKQYDRDYALDFEIRNGSEVFDLTGCTILVNLLKPDENEYVGIGEITSAVDGFASVRLDNNRQMTAAAGEGLLELVIIYGSMTRGTANARFIVQESPASASVISGTVIEGISALAADVASSVSSASASASAAAAAAQAAIAAKDEAEAIAIGNIRDIMFPVGSIVQYASASIDPNALIGGTWQRIQGKFLFAADSTHAIGSTGGSETVSLTTANLPAHRHMVMNSNAATATPTGSNTLARYDRSFGSREGEYYNLNANGNEANWGQTSAVGGGTAHNNMPPYVAVYVWKRTA